MRSIERRFLLEQEKSPLVSTFIIFTRTVKNQKFSERVIKNWFKRLVDVEDYAKGERKKLLEFLVGVSNG